jgi:hypothetical protein
MDRAGAVSVADDPSFDSLPSGADIRSSLDVSVYPAVLI